MTGKINEAMGTKHPSGSHDQAKPGSADQAKPGSASQDAQRALHSKDAEAPKEAGRLGKGHDKAKPSH